MQQRPSRQRLSSNAAGLSEADGSTPRSVVYRNPYLLEQPDRADPASDSIGFAGRVLEPLLKRGEGAPLRLVSREVLPFVRGEHARQWLRKLDGPSLSHEQKARLPEKPA